MIRIVVLLFSLATATAAQERTEDVVLFDFESGTYQDTDGRWYASHAGNGQGGLWLAPLWWNDGLDDTGKPWDERDK